MEFSGAKDSGKADQDCADWKTNASLAGRAAGMNKMRRPRSGIRLLQAFLFAPGRLTGVIVV
jgi:hypothetical protein